MNPVKNNTENEDDAEQMRLAFEAFMLKGKGAATSDAGGDIATNTTNTTSGSKKKKKKKRPSTGPSPQKQKAIPPSPITFSSPSKVEQSTKKRYYQLLRSFSNKIQQSWFEVDDQILAILESIVGIRTRLPLEWKLLNSYDAFGERNDDEKGTEADWKCHGFRRTSGGHHPFHLHRNDVQLALNNDLEQHEKMMTALRSLIAELSECHDSLGRLVDTIWTFHVDNQQDADDTEYEENNEYNDMEILVQNASDLFQILSEELYRKQCLIPSIIATTHDEMLGESSNPIGAGSAPLEEARRCHRLWSRRVDQRLVDWILKLGSQ